MVALRAHHEIDERSPRDKLVSFRLSDAAGNGDHRGAVACGEAGPPQALQPPQFRVDLFGRFITDVARIKNDHVGDRRIVHDRVSERRQNVDDPGGVVDVHLAAVGLDVERFRHRPRQSVNGERAERPLLRSQRQPARDDTGKG